MALSSAAQTLGRSSANAASLYGQDAATTAGNALTGSFGASKVAQGNASVTTAGWSTLGTAQAENQNAEALKQASQEEQLRHSEMDAAIGAIATTA